MDAASTLDPEALLDAARASTGLTDLGVDTWREGLARLVDALQSEAHLNEIGVQVAAGEILLYLSNRLRIVDWHRQHPELARADVTPPIVAWSTIDDVLRLLPES